MPTQQLRTLTRVRTSTRTKTLVALGAIAASTAAFAVISQMSIRKATPIALLGDIDKNGRIETNDLTLMNQILRGQFSDRTRADLDRNGRIDNQDYTILSEKVRLKGDANYDGYVDYNDYLAVHRVINTTSAGFVRVTTSELAKLDVDNDNIVSWNDMGWISNFIIFQNNYSPNTSPYRSLYTFPSSLFRGPYTTPRPVLPPSPPPYTAPYTNPYTAPNTYPRPTKAYDYQIITQSAYTAQVNPGQSQTVYVELKNIGTQTWKNTGASAVGLISGSTKGTKNQRYGYRSELYSPSATPRWLSPSRPANIMHPEVRTGWNTRITFKITAPNLPGTYKAYFTPVAGTSSVMRDNGLYWQITARSARNIVMKGDMNADGKIDKTDVSLLSQMSTGSIPQNIAVGDMNGDGQILNNDVILLSRQVK